MIDAKKVFKESGKLKLIFAAHSIEQILQWLGDVDLQYAMQFATHEYDDPVFGHAITFPCEIRQF